MPLTVAPLQGLGQLAPYVLQGPQGGGGNYGVAADAGGGASGGGYYSSPSGGSGGTAAPAVDPNQIALYDQSIGNTQSAIDRLPAQGASQWSGIDASYQNALNQLLLGENQANASYKTNKQQTAQNFVGAKNTIGANAGNSLNGLERLLGSRGAGGSSAALYGAPQAVAGNATVQRAGAGTTFGQNNQSLDTNWNNYETGVNNQRSSATSQRDQSRLSLQQQIENNKAQLLQSLAGLQQQEAQYQGGNPAAASQASIDQANALLNQTANYSINPISYQTQAYTAPQLSAYTVNPTAAPTYNGQSAGNDYVTPYLASLLGGKKQTNTAAAAVGA